LRDAGNTIVVIEHNLASCQLWPVGILARCLVFKDLVQCHSIELAGCVLYDSADPDVPNVLTVDFCDWHVV
jgi:hypothetical protein